MDQETFTAVDHYLTDLLAPADEALDHALRASSAAGLPSINVSAMQGKFLHLLARMIRAKNILEIGTLGGYSTIWLARALEPGGKLITLEADSRHAEVAQKNLEFAKLADRVELMLGKALETLPVLSANHRGPFDLVFIDADKTSIPEYFDWAVKLSRVGSVIVVDNVVRKGAVADPNSSDPSVQGVRRFNAQLAKDKRVSATTLQTAGIKGYDGIAIALVVAN